MKHDLNISHALPLKPRYPPLKATKYFPMNESESPFPILPKPRNHGVRPGGGGGYLISRCSPDQIVTNTSYPTFPIATLGSCFSWAFRLAICPYLSGAEGWELQNKTLSEGMVLKCGGFWLSISHLLSNSQDRNRDFRMQKSVVFFVLENRMECSLELFLSTF